MYQQSSIFDFKEPTGSELKNAGIKKAIDSANAKEPTWSNKAFEALKDYIKNTVGSGFHFMTENFRDWVVRWNKLPAPPSNRAYGGVIAKAKHQKLIKCTGTQSVSNPKAHCANASVWVVL